MTSLTTWLKERESQPSVSVDKVVHFAIEAGRRSM